MSDCNTPSIKQQLGDQLNGIVNYDFWEPAKTLQFPGVVDFLKKYQARAAAEGVDPLGYYLPPFAYANMQVLEQAVEGDKEPGRRKARRVAQENKIKTIVGDIEYGPNGEWKEPRVMQVQFHDVKGSDLDQWKTDAKQTILWPDNTRPARCGIPTPRREKAAARRRTARRAAARNSLPRCPARGCAAPFAIGSAREAGLSEALPAARC